MVFKLRHYIYVLKFQNLRNSKVLNDRTFIQAVSITSYTEKQPTLITLEKHEFNDLSGL